MCVADNNHVFPLINRTWEYIFQKLRGLIIAFLWVIWIFLWDLIFFFFSFVFLIQQLIFTFMTELQQKLEDSPSSTAKKLF